jgi:hypothetical protein
MLDSPLIEVAIGLSFVFLLLSLLVSSVCEMLAGLFGWRAQYLWAGIETLLRSPDARARVYDHPLIKGLAPLPAVARPVSGFLAKIGLVRGHGPSYIPSRTFALALLDVIRQPHAMAATVEARVSGLVELAERNPSALAASLSEVLSRLEDDPALAAVAARLHELRNKVCSAVDPSVLAGLTLQVGNALDAALQNTQGLQGSLAPVATWLELASQAKSYVELRASLAEAVAAIPTGTPAARACRTALEGVLERFQTGSLQEIARELRAFLGRSQEVKHALAHADHSMRELSGALTPLLEDAAGDVELFRQGVETWFNNSMDRVSGAYKRHTLAWQAAIGLVLAVGMNVDALYITRALWRDKAMREAVVAQAESVARAPSPTGEAAQFSSLRAQVESLGLPVGWRACDDRATTTTSLQTPLLWCEGGGWNWVGLLPMLLGWCLTAAAVSLGAPFWFDTLRRFVSIRSSGKAPSERVAQPPQITDTRDR